MTEHFPAQMLEFGEFVLYNGLASSSRRTYASGIKKYLEFCNIFSVSPFPADTAVLAMFFVWRVFVLGKRKPDGTRDYDKFLSFSTIQVNISAIISAHTDRGLPAAAFKTALWKRIERGWHRLLGDETRDLDPVTVKLLQQLVPLLPHDRVHDPLHFLNLNYLTIFTVCVYGVARLREIVWDSGVEQLRALRISNISFVPSVEEPQRLEILLLGSKTDYWHQGVNLAIPCVCGTNSPCPVMLLQELLRRRPLLELPNGLMDHLWVKHNGRVIQAPAVVKKLKELVQKLDLKPERFNGHSFRKGGCQSMIDAGCSVEDAKCAGRWLSDSVRVYFKRSATERARLAGQMALTV